MLIANPIYDTVFKYLMENIDIAKGIISTILDEEIITLDFSSQESIYKKESYLAVYHLDFIAKIKLKTGGYKHILIEMQKSNISYDIMRFRNYLAEQYKKIDEVVLDDGSVIKGPLPIITIYFLGFHLSKTLPPVIKINRNVIDVLYQTHVIERNDFIELLTHDSFIIQVPALQLEMRNELEWVLSIFQQENFIDNTHRLKDYDHSPRNELINKILKQLEKAAADKDLLRQIELEEQAERETEAALGQLRRDLEFKDKKLDEMNLEINVKKKELDDMNKELDDKKKEIYDKDKYIKDLLNKLNEKKGNI